MTVNFTRGLSNWTTGTATATNGSATVSFTGANLISADPSDASVDIYVAGEGDMFIVDGIGAVPIKSVDSASQVTLDYPWPYATQTGVAYRIRRYNEVKTGEVAKHIQAAQTIGQDSNPFVTVAADDGVARVKLRESGGAVQIAVGPTGTADASLKAGLSIDPSSGVASFPKGMIHNNPGFRNRIENGLLDVWQRGTTFALANGASAYTADRRRITNNTGVSITVSQVARPGGFIGRYALNIAATAVPSGGYVTISNRLSARDVFDLDTKSCVLSLDVNATTTAGALSAYSRIARNTSVDGGQFSDMSASSAFAVPTGTGRPAVAFTGAQTAGLWNGGDVQIVFQQGAATGDWNVSVGALQFEADPSGAGKANPFEFRPFGFDLVLCRRYYQTIALQPLYGITASATSLMLRGLLQVTMRSSPTLSLLKTSWNQAGTPYEIAAGSGWPAAATGVSISSSTTDPRAFAATLIGFSGLTTGQPVIGNSPSQDVFALSAEL